MKFLVLVLLFGLAAAKIERKLANADLLEKQKKVMTIFEQLGSGVELNHHETKTEFMYDKPEMYKCPKVLTKFMEIYKRGLLDRDGVFTLSCHKTRHDTFKLFELLYNAKDFDTFIKISKWARIEVNPLQFIYAFITAVIHRMDCKDIIIPPLYEIMPHYFVPNTVMTMAMHAMMTGEKMKKFEVNNTGWEWSWHRDMLSGHFRFGDKWNGDDMESRMAYFREDVNLQAWYSMFMMQYAPWLSNEKHPEIHMEKQGELLLSAHNWLAKRYNLERWANKLPPTPPLDFDQPITSGYNPQLSDMMGRNILPRPDGMIPMKDNSYAIWDVEMIERRIYDAIDMQHLMLKNNSILELDEKDGIDLLAKAVFGTRDSANRGFYHSLYYRMMEAIDGMVTMKNNREFTMGTMGRTLTATRDPAFYMMLTSIQELFATYTSSFPPYTHEQLDFPGVKLERLEMDKLITYFERYEFEITNGIPLMNPADITEIQYLASQFRLNHKPFSYKMLIKSDKAIDAMVRVFIGPKHDSEFRPLTWNQIRHSMVGFDYFIQKLNVGENMVTRNSHEMEFLAQIPHARAYFNKVTNSISTKEPLYITPYMNCMMPPNLMVPRGSRGGKEYMMFVIVTPFERRVDTPEPGVCGHNMMLDQHPLGFPFDRYIKEMNFDTANMFTKDITIYHKTELEVNRPE